MKLQHIISTSLLALLIACGSAPSTTGLQSTSTTVSAESAVPVEALNADVRQETIHQTICVPGYAASVRPSATYTNGVKLKLLREQGLPATLAADFELDHRIPLALGGHPRNPGNLMLQPWGGDDGAKKKDRLERKLQQLVCSGKMLLDDARRRLYSDWPVEYRRQFGSV